MIRILLPVHLRRLAGVEGEIQVDLVDRPTLGAALDAVYDGLRSRFRRATCISPVQEYPFPTSE